MNKKRLIVIGVLAGVLLSVSSNIFSQSLPADVQEYPEEAFPLSAGVDVPVIIAGAVLFVSEIFIEPVVGIQQNREDLFFLDRLSIFDYNSGLDSAGDILFAASLLLPISTVIGVDIDTIIETGVMFLEAMVLTYSVKDIIKDLIPRYRPYTYLSEPVDDDYMNSFPSGHTAAVFAVCGFASYVFAEMYPDSVWKVPLIIGASTIAVTVGTLRVVSGNHFVTDAAAGAVIGSFFGIGIPLLHKSRLADETGIALGIAAGEDPAFTVSFRI